MIVIIGNLHPFKKSTYFLLENFAVIQLSIQSVCRYKNLPLLKMLRMRSVPNRTKKNKLQWLVFFNNLKNWSLHLFGLQKTAMNYNIHIYIIIHDTRKDSLCRSTSLLFCVIAVAFVFQASSLLAQRKHYLENFNSILISGQLILCSFGIKCHMTPHGGDNILFLILKTTAPS